MPLYDYRCKKCGIEVELEHPVEMPGPRCNVCGQKMEKQISPTPAILKGGCWAKDGYSKRDK